MTTHAAVHVVADQYKTACGLDVWKEGDDMVNAEGSPLNVANAGEPYDCPACQVAAEASSLSVPLTLETLNGLRRVRLYHWQMVLANRKLARNTVARADARIVAVRLQIMEEADRHEKVAIWHAKAVEALDIFFPAAGDTAARDLDIQARSRERV